MILSDSFVNLTYSVYSSLKTAFFKKKIGHSNYTDLYGTAISRRPSLISDISQGYQGGVSRISKMQGETKQKPSKNITHTKKSRLVIFNIAIWSSNLWYTFTSALDKIMDDVINCLDLGANVVFLT